jgi:hypothetical protein
MYNEFELIQRDKSAAVFGIIGYIFIYVAANLAESELSAVKVMDKEMYGKSAEKASAIASTLLLIALIIRGRNASINLRDKQAKLIKGEKVDSIIPNIYITSGYALGILGNSLRLLGNLIRVNEPQ